MWAPKAFSLKRMSPWRVPGLEQRKMATEADGEYQLTCQQMLRGGDQLWILPMEGWNWPTGWYAICIYPHL